MKAKMSYEEWKEKTKKELKKIQKTLRFSTAIMSGTDFKTYTKKIREVGK
jgi:hypothetical protein